MKTRKSLGLVACMVVVATALFGTASASATTLCKINENPCPAGQRYAETETVTGHILHEALFEFEVFGENRLLFEGICTEAAFKLTNTKNNGPNKVLNGSLSSLTFEGCKELGQCETATALHLPYNSEMLGSAINGTGFSSLSNSGKGKPAIRLGNCTALKWSCNYETAVKPALQIFGATIATAEVKWEMPSEVGHLECGEKVVITGFFEVTSPNPLFVEREP